jgi:hypothetical protein
VRRYVCQGVEIVFGAAVEHDEEPAVATEPAAEPLSPEDERRERLELLLRSSGVPLPGRLKDPRANVG